MILSLERHSISHNFFSVLVLSSFSMLCALQLTYTVAAAD